MRKVMILFSLFLIVKADGITDCTMHSCFGFTYTPTGSGDREKEGLYSGDFKGSDFNTSIDELNISDKVRTRIFR